MRKIDVFAIDCPRVLFHRWMKAFRPAVLANRNFQREVDPAWRAAGSRLGTQRGMNSPASRPKFFPKVIPISKPIISYVERIVKFLLWQRGGHTLYVGGSPEIAEYIRKAYSAELAQESLIITLWASRLREELFCHFLRGR